MTRYMSILQGMHFRWGPLNGRSIHAPPLGNTKVAGVTEGGKGILEGEQGFWMMGEF